MITALLIAALCVLPPLSQPLADRVDLIELNHNFDAEGRELFVQTIFWEWNDREGRFQVRTFRIVKHESQLPYPSCCGREEYRALWLDGDVNRLVVAPSYRETWTQCFDPEVHDRELLPKELRRGLSEPVRKR